VIRVFCDLCDKEVESGAELSQLSFGELSDESKVRDYNRNSLKKRISHEVCWGCRVKLLGEVELIRTLRASVEKVMIHIWFDDERAPGSLSFYQKEPYVGVEWTWVKTVPAFKKLIAEVGIENIGFVALDHDLGICKDCDKRFDDIAAETDGKLKTIFEATRPLRDEVLIQSGDTVSYSSCIHNGDGTQLINWMEDTGTWPTRPPTVHSFNPDGSRRMREVIVRHYFERAR
jgi:hypothetical protein